MSKRVCLITGASGLLGNEFIRRCAARYRIIAVHHQSNVHFAAQDQTFVDPLDTARAVELNQHPVHAVRADLSKPEDIDSLVREVVGLWGSVDLLINAAAVRAFAPLLAPDGLSAIESILSLNVLAPLRLTIQLARTVWRLDPEANARAKRNVVNLSSTAGLFVYEDLGQALYASSKAALNHLTYHLASELWDIGVRVNAVAPDTFPGRVSLDDVLDAILALDAGSGTGQIVPLCPAEPWRSARTIAEEMVR